MEDFEQKEVEVGGQKYILRSFNAIEGLSILTRLQNFAAAGDVAPPANFIVEVISKGAQLGSLEFNEKLIGKHFKRKYKELIELYGKVIAFNFDLDAEGKNEQSGTSEE